VKFLVDLPLGGLAKWLRFCGFDAATRRLAPDPRTLPPPAPDTYILTRQEAFRPRRRPDLLVLTAPTPEAQLQEVLRRLRIPRSRLDLLSRCSRCNEPLTPVPREQALGRVPEHIFHYHEQFYECPRCRRLFWPGSHLNGITRSLGEGLPKPLKLPHHRKKP
jgi:hypothetical protein